jgi:arylsulfatase A-like enzyme
MNVILVYSDTMRRDHLGAYGNTRIHTPNLDRLADQSAVLDKAYTSSFPTVPNRLDVLTGRFTFPYFEWARMPANEVSIGEELRKHDFITMMIGDTPWIFAYGYNFSRGFSGWNWIRGQEHDELSTYPFNPALPCDAQKLRLAETSTSQYLRNVARRYWEEDYFPAKTMHEAARWLEENRKAPNFFLYVDTFDPHEPWDPPAHYLELYEKDFKGERVIYPKYTFSSRFSAEEVRHMRAAYAGEVTLVDSWIGYLLKRVEELGLAHNTAVIFTTEHGFCLGEHDLVGKAIIENDTSAHVPLWDVISHIPLFIKAPGLRPRRTDAVVQTPDITATIYELAGAPTPKTVQGKSLVPVLTGKRDDHREFAVSSSSLVHGKRARRFSTVTMDNWQLIYGGEKYEGAAALASTVDSIRRCEVAYKPEEPGIELYDLATDPDQIRNVASDRRDVVERLHRRYVEFLGAIGCPTEHLENRLRLPEF